ncbi:hypothetical protein BD414DRAFT_579272 [Trametes punicea]|nr:hypothetical protein BD414DRAFT_579272 [Trametes punicea]
MSSTDGTVALNNYLQQKGRLTSLSWEDKQTGPRHAAQWTSLCKIDGETMGTGEGSKLTTARDAAANEALAALLAKDRESGDGADASSSVTAT